MQNLDPKLAGYYRKAAAVIKIVRFAVLLAFVLFCVYCIGFFRDNITVDNMRYVLKYINLSATDNTPSDTSITISTDESSTFTMLHNDLAVVSNSGCELYDFSGSKLFSYDYSYTDAAFVSNGNNFLVYDTQGKELALYSSVSKVLKKTLDYDIKAADINDIGYFAVVNSEKTYRSGVIVFDVDGNEIFRWMSPDKYVMSVSLNSNGSYVACAAISNKNGSFVTDLIIYNTSTGEKMQTVTLEDTMALKIGYANNDSNIYVLTDGRFLCYDKDLKLVGAQSYNAHNARFFKEFDDCFIISQSNNLSGSSMTVYAYDYEGRLVFEHHTDNKITDVSYTDSTLYILTRESISVYDYDTTGKGLTFLAEMPVDKQYKAVKTDDYGRYILVGAKNAARGSLATLLQSQLDAD